MVAQTNKSLFQTKRKYHARSLSRTDNENIKQTLLDLKYVYRAGFLPHD